MSASVTFSAHAEAMMAERAIERDWVVRTILDPEQHEVDPTYPDRLRAFRALPERDGRVLRVVYVLTEGGLRIITVFLDRGRQR